MRSDLLVKLNAGGAWKFLNTRGAIDISRRPQHSLDVVGDGSNTILNIMTQLLTHLKVLFKIFKPEVRSFSHFTSYTISHRLERLHCSQDGTFRPEDRELRK
jgi:hypothetical protein